MKEFWTKLCCSLLRALGIVAVGASVSACYGMPYDPVCMYGTPSADLDLVGQVTNENDEPIGGIAVTYRSDEHKIMNFTDDKGDFHFVLKGSSGLREASLVAKDIDGEQNGSYEADSLKIDKKNFEQIAKGDNAWYMGKYQAKDLKIKLKAKN